MENNPGNVLGIEESGREAIVDPEEARKAEANRMANAEQRSLPMDKVESPFSKGKERLAAMGNFFNRSKDRFNNVTSGVKNKLSSFWDKAKNAGTVTAEAVLSADELAKKGASAVVEGGKTVGRETMKGFRTFGEWLGKRKDKMVEFANGKVKMMEDFGTAVKTKTKDGLENAGKAIGKRFGEVVAFGSAAMEGAKMGARTFKNEFNESMNNVRLNRIEAKIKEEQDKISEAVENIKKLNDKKVDLQQKMLYQQFIKDRQTQGQPQVAAA